jgi:ribosomal protein L30/L7E
MNLSKTDRLSPIWQVVKDHLEARLMRLRVMNENESLDAVQTASIRGRIAEVKGLLSIGEDPVEIH